MDEINKLFQSYVNLEKKDLLNIVAESMKGFMPVCRVVDKKSNGNFCLAMMISSAFGADGKLTDDEIEFLVGVGIDVELIKSILSHDNLFDMIDKLVDAMNAEQKAYAVSFMTALCALDGKIASEENAFLRKLIA